MSMNCLKWMLLLSSVGLLMACREKGAGMQYVSDTPSLSVDTAARLVYLDLPSEITKTDVYECIDSIHVIPLSSSDDDAIVGHIDGIYIQDSKLFVTDLYKAKGVFVFDMSGNYLYKIGRSGNGPGEYASLNDVRFTTEHVDVLDWISWKYIRYDLSGRFLEEHSLMDVSPSKAVLRKDGTWLFFFQRYTPDRHFRLVLADSSLKPVDTALPFSNDRSMGPGRVWEEDSLLYYYYHLCDTIYQITENSLSPKYKLSIYDPGEVERFFEKTKELDLNDFNRALEQDIASYYTFYEADDYYYVLNQKLPEIYLSLLDKKTLKGKTFLQSDIEQKKLNFPFYIYGVADNWLLAFIDAGFFDFLPESAQEEFLSHLSKEKADEVRRIGSDSDNNPIICMFHISVDKLYE